MSNNGDGYNDDEYKWDLFEQNDYTDEILDGDILSSDVFGMESNVKHKRAKIVQFQDVYQEAVSNSVGVEAEEVVSCSLPQEEVKKKNNIATRLILMIVSLLIAFGVGYFFGSNEKDESNIMGIEFSSEEKDAIIDSLLEQYYVGDIFYYTGVTNNWEYVNPNEYAERIKNSGNVDAAIYAMDKNNTREFGYSGDNGFYAAVINSVFSDGNQTVAPVDYYSSVVGRLPGESDDDVANRYYEEIENILIQRAIIGDYKTGGTK